MHKLGSVLVLLCLVLGLNHGEKELREEETEKDPLEFLVFPGGNDMEALFGFEIVEYLHAERLRCGIKERKAELKFTNQLDHMMRYLRQAKMTISQPEFEELATENKKDLERNFQKAFKDLEISHFRKQSRLHRKCEEELEFFMEDRMRRVMHYSDTLLRSDIEGFMKLAHDMLDYQNNLQFGLNECIVYMERISVDEHFEDAGHFFDLCYGNEVVLLLRFLRNFTTLAQDLMERMFDVEPTDDEIILIDPSKIPVPEEPPSDLEDGDVDDEGFGSGTTPTEVQTTPTEAETTLTEVETTMYEYEYDSTSPEEETTTTDKSTEELTTGKEKVVDPKVVEVLEPGPVVLDKTGKPATKPRPQRPTTELENPKDSTTTEAISKEDVLKKFKGALEPGPVVLDKTGKPVTEPEKPKETTTKEYPEWVEKDFKDIQEMGEKKENTKENEVPKPQRAKSSSKESESEPGLSIDLDLPGVDAGVDVQIGPNGVQIDTQGGGMEEIVFEEEVTTTEAPTDSDHHGHRFKALFFIYFFATLGILLAITLVILIVVIVSLKMKRRNGPAKDAPLLSEEEKIAVMKQSGYVNPTYQFFDQVKDV